ncbi:MAG: hypothetical protein GY940_10550, partial [bacterium]|nr:hypothetical protein [bacterium]
MKYSKWLNIHLTHGYFADGRETSFQFVPTQDCEKQLKLYRFLFRSTDFGFAILEDSEKEQENNREKTVFFDIAVYARDPYFPTYSNLDIDYMEGKVYYIGNRLKNETGETGANGLTLEDRQSGETFEAVRVLLQPKRFTFYAEAAPGDTFKLTDKQNNPVRQWKIEDKEGTGGTTGFYADVSSKPAGILTLYKNGDTAAHFYADDRLYHHKPAFITGLGVPPPGTEPKGPQRLRQYDIRVASRSVSWNYHVY